LEKLFWVRGVGKEDPLRGAEKKAKKLVSQ